MVDKWLTQIPYERDGLFEILARPNEGWRITDEQNSYDVPLGKLDAVAYRILENAIESHKHVVIALPRVKTGVSLSIIAYLVVNRFIKLHGRTFKDFHPINLDNSQSILIATQNRKLRDFFLQSSLRFTNSDFPFSCFPIYRLNHKGELIPLATKSESKGQININPIVFYHFDMLETFPAAIESGYLLGELTETNSPNLAKRLCDFINATRTQSSVVLVNEYSERVLSILRENGFHVVFFGTNELGEMNSAEEYKNLPSICSSLNALPKTITLHLHILEDKTIDTKLTKILEILMSLNKKFTSDKPRLLTKAWGIFYMLKDSCVPITSLELYRKRNPWLRTIKHSVQQVFQFPLAKLEEPERTALGPIWGTLEAEFNELYTYMEQHSPKYDYILKLLGNSKYKQHSIIFSSQGQAEVLKEELLLKSVSDKEGSFEDIPVFFINDLINNSQVCKDVILSGVWKKTDEPKIFSLLPHEINLICYCSELPAIPTLLSRINKNYRDEWDNETTESLKLIQLHIDGSDNPTHSAWLKPDADSQFFIDYFKEFIPKTEDSTVEYDNYDWLTAQPEEPDESDLEEPEETSDEETTPAYKVTLENDRNIYIPVDKEVMVYSEDGEIQSKVSDMLEPGDIILIYSEEQSHEMFESVLQRTQELSGVDTRITSIWKSALKVLRDKYNVKTTEAIKLYINDLKKNNCTKTEQTARAWLRGVTLAPRDEKDIACLLNLAEYKNVSSLAHLIYREIENIRSFHRILGKRLKERLENLIRGEKIQEVESKKPIDREIDEILEKAEPVSIKEISKDIRNVKKNEVRINVLG